MSKGRSIARRLAEMAGTGLAVAALFAAPAAAADVSSTFDTDLDGWTVSGDPAVAYPIWVGTGGNPDGYARTLDRGAGIYMFWQAPPKFEGDQSDKLGGVLSFDVRVSPATTNNWPDVYLESAGLLLAANTLDAHTGGWDANSVPLEGAAWRPVTSYDTPKSGMGAPVSDGTLAAVLGSLDRLVVRAENSTFIDRDDLDNVLMAAPSAPVGLELDPASAEQEAGATHCVTATVLNANGDPLDGVIVRFTTTGATSSSESPTTGADGTATHCFEGPALPGVSDIFAYADSNGDDARDDGEPADTATVTWTRPATGTDCKVTGGGKITTAGGSRGTFGGNAMVKDGVASGHQTYHDHGGGRAIEVDSIESVICSAGGDAVSIFGTATDGSAVRLDLGDGGEPGTSDTYRIRTSDGYDSGTQVLDAGNVQVH